MLQIINNQLLKEIDIWYIEKDKLLKSKTILGFIEKTLGYIFSIICINKILSVYF